MSISNVCSNVYNYIPNLCSINPPSSIPWGRVILALGSATALLGLGAYSWSHRKETVEFSQRWTGQVKERISKTYAYVMGGFTLTAVSATVSHLSGLSARLLTSHPIVRIGLFGAAIGSLIATMSLSKEKQVMKHIAWGAFNVTMGITLSPLGFLNKSIIAQAATITLGVGGAFSLFAALAPDEAFLKYEAPFLSALTALTIATTAACLFPRSAFAFAVDRISLYGGLGLFSLALLIDTQRVLKDANKKVYFDPIDSSLGLYLNNMNIFVRILKLLVENQEKNR